MTEYQKQTLAFLEACNATMNIEFWGVMINQNWDDYAKRNRYHFTITTPRGTMSGDFWDSIKNTEITLMTVEDYERKIPNDFSYLLGKSREQMLNAIKATTKPTEYDILACLIKYDPGTMNEFFDEFGYEIHSGDDLLRFLNTYNAAVKEYRDLCRIFTEEQMDMLRNIQ
jgi:hypothetical protein